MQRGGGGQVGSRTLVALFFGMKTPDDTELLAPVNLYSAACVQSTCSPVQLQCLCGMTSPVLTIVNMQCNVLQGFCVGL